MSVPSPAVIVALEGAVKALEKEAGSLEQAMQVASNERNGREGEIAARIDANRRELQQVHTLINQVLEEA